jgi:putative oxidoreductase
MNPSTTTQNLLALIGRALIALLFLPSGIGKITGFAGTVRYITAANLPMPEVAAAIGILVEVVLVLLLLVGWQTRWVALGIAIYTVVLAFGFHHYWDMPAAQMMAQKFNFYKNLAIAGGLLSFAAWGAGAWSLDAKHGRAEPAMA